MVIMHFWQLRSDITPESGPLPQPARPGPAEPQTCSRAVLGPLLPVGLHGFPYRVAAVKDMGAELLVEVAKVAGNLVEDQRLTKRDVLFSRPA